VNQTAGLGSSTVGPDINNGGAGGISTSNVPGAENRGLQGNSFAPAGSTSTGGAGQVVNSSGGNGGNNGASLQSVGGNGGSVALGTTIGNAGNGGSGGAGGGGGAAGLSTGNFSTVGTAGTTSSGGTAAQNGGLVVGKGGNGGNFFGNPLLAGQGSLGLIRVAPTSTFAGGGGGGGENGGSGVLFNVSTPPDINGGGGGCGVSYHQPSGAELRPGNPTAGAGGYIAIAFYP
jgi:hypothetical protein